jgi:hypothetical protein
MFGAFDIDSLHFETRLLIRRVRELTGESERDAVHRAMADRYLRLTTPDTLAERRQQGSRLLDSIWFKVSEEAFEDAIGRTQECTRAEPLKLSAADLYSIATRAPGFDTVLDDIMNNTMPRVCATALVEAATLLRASGDARPQKTLQRLIDSLNITVVPFTESDWKAAARQD